MVDISSVDLQAWLSAFLWPFFRITAFISVCPVFGHSSIPTKVKIGVGAMLTLVMLPLLPPAPDMPIVSIGSFAIIAEQLMIGISIGLCMRIMFAVVQSAGEFIALQMGLGFATFFSPDSGMQSAVISRLLNMIALLMFLALNGHLYLMELVLSTFSSLPVGGFEINPGAWKLLAQYASTIFTSGILLALPLMGALLMMNLAMGILNRSAPQLTIFSIGFPLTLTSGLVLMMFMMRGMDLEKIFADNMLFIDTLIHTIGATPGE